jgi:hypothetical protein
MSDQVTSKKREVDYLEVKGDHSGKNDEKKQSGKIETEISDNLSQEGANIMS